MDTPNKFEVIERRVEALDLTMAFVLRRAKVPAATWARWKQGKQHPTEEKLTAITEAVDDLERRLA